MQRVSELEFDYFLHRTGAEFGNMYSVRELRLEHVVQHKGAEVGYGSRGWDYVLCMEGVGNMYVFDPGKEVGNTFIGLSERGLVACRR
jgi:hypothetical protein